MVRLVSDLSDSFNRNAIETRGCAAGWRQF